MVLCLMCRVADGAMSEVSCGSICDVGYFEQFGKCVSCPPSSGASVGALLGISMLLIVLCIGIFLIRTLLPVDVLKLGLSMLQVGSRSSGLQ